MIESFLWGILFGGTAVGCFTITAYQILCPKVDTDEWRRLGNRKTDYLVSAYKRGLSIILDDPIINERARVRLLMHGLHPKNDKVEQMDIFNAGIEVEVGNE